MVDFVIDVSVTVYALVVTIDNIGFAQNDFIKYGMKSHLQYLRSTYFVQIKYTAKWHKRLRRIFTLKLNRSPKLFQNYCIERNLCPFCTISTKLCNFTESFGQPLSRQFPKNLLLEMINRASVVSLHAWFKTPRPFHPSPFAPHVSIHRYTPP